MKPTTQYKKMCIEAFELQEKWIPNDGDYFNSNASYCCSDEQKCTDLQPCFNCLKMNNVFVLAGNHYNKVFLFNPVLCNRDGGTLLNDTSASIFIPNNADSMKFALKIHTYMPTHQETVSWLPRQDQLQQMIINTDPFIGKDSVERFIDLTGYFSAYIHTFQKGTFDSLEGYWLSFVMEKLYKKKWTNNSWVSIKEIIEIS